MPDQDPDSELVSGDPLEDLNEELNQGLEDALELQDLTSAIKLGYTIIELLEKMADRLTGDQNANSQAISRLTKR